MSKGVDYGTGARSWLAAGAIFCGLGVALGALGAHLLKKPVQEWYPPEKAEVMLGNWDTGVQYQLIHGLGLISVGLLARTARPGGVPINLIGFSWAAGVILFSGGLYVRVLTDWHVAVMVVPIGGISFLFGWFLFLWAIIRSSPARPAE